jgi:hypothetical protein
VKENEPLPPHVSWSELSLVFTPTSLVVPQKISMALKPMVHWALVLLWTASQDI